MKKTSNFKALYLLGALLIVLTITLPFMIKSCEKKEPVYKIVLVDSSGRYEYGKGQRLEYEYDGETHLWDAYLMYYADGNTDKKGEVLYSLTNQGQNKTGDENFRIVFSVVQAQDNESSSTISSLPKEIGKYELKYYGAANSANTNKIKYIPISVYIYII